MYLFLLHKVIFVDSLGHQSAAGSSKHEERIHVHTNNISSSKKFCMK